MRLLLPLSLAFAVACSSTQASPRDEAPAPARDAMVRIDMPLRTMMVPLSEPIRDALRASDWDEAAKLLMEVDRASLVGNQRGAWAFVAAWSLVRAERAAEGIPLLPLIEGTEGLPVDDVALLTAEILRAEERTLDALAAVDRVPASSPRWGRAVVVRAELLRELGRTREAYELYEGLVERPDPALGSAEALLALALRAGAENPAAYPYLRRLWAYYPSSESFAAGEPLLAAYTGSQYAPTWEQIGARAETLMWQGKRREAIQLTGTQAASVEGTGFEACRYVYVRGRSMYRENELTASIAAFGDQGERCEGDGADFGAKIQYLKGTAQFRKRQYEASAATFLALADRYPESYLADDGLLHAGIAFQELEQLDRARETWLRGLDAFPEGDTVPEASFRVAFSYYLDGQTEQAIDIAKALGELPLSGDHTQVAAGRYWHARWLMYPDVEHPTVPTDDEERRASAISEWVRLCEEMPHSFYAIQAYSRLVEVAPQLATALAQRPATWAAPDMSRPWVVRRELAEDPHLIAGVALARVGLVNEARADWSEVAVDDLLPDERAWLTELRIASGDWLFAHDEMRGWFKSHPPDALGEGAAEVLRIGYPDRYWTEVQTAAEGDGFPPRLFHGLVREESNFNRSIRSHAGARGLSQLMPATAREVAGWLGTSVTMEQLTDPATNLRIGTRYYDALYDQLDGSPYLMCAGYNAGAGRVRQWRGEWGDIPTDEYVERIPFKETREYVKRVMGTWQTYNYQFDADQPAFPDLSAYNHSATP